MVGLGLGSPDASSLEDTCVEEFCARARGKADAQSFSGRALGDGWRIERCTRRSAVR